LPSGERPISPPAPGWFRLVLGKELRSLSGTRRSPLIWSTFGFVKRFWSLARRYWFDALLLAGLGLALTGAVIGQGNTDGPTGPLWFDLLAIVAILTPLFARRRFPFGAPAAVGIAAVLTSFVDGRLVPFDFIIFLAGCASVFLIGLIRERAQAVAGLVLAWGVVAVVAYRDPIGNLDGLIAASVIFGIIWTIAFAVGRKFQEADEARERATRAEREREDRARTAVTEERARIARELHDVVGHSVSVMTVQASAVRRLLRPEQQREREALLVVERTGREALAEMRRMVGVLRRPEEAPALAPQPSLEHLNKLVDQAREAGLPVELRVEGDPQPLPAGVDLTAYRLVQEGLTNALKHARAKRAEVLVRYGAGEIEVTVSDDGQGAGSGDGGGHGLVGMRERVAVYGGVLETGARPEGGYRLRARLPVAPT
jgi:signal transduction histidine kinase